MAEYYVFGGDYETGMDRAYEPLPIGMGEMPVNKIGISTPPMKDQLESLKARIFQGASKVELGFMGVQKGSMSQGAVTPEMYGREEREAIRDLAKINKIELSVHASPGMGSPSGLDPRQGKFSEENQQTVIDEVKRTVDFTADTAGGGPVVIHTGEWNRPIVDAEKSSEYKGKFEAYKGEKEKAVFYAVDERTGQLTAIRKDLEIIQPKKDEKGNYVYKDGMVEMEKLKYDQLLQRAKKEFPDMTAERALITYLNDSNLKRQHSEALRFLEDVNEANEGLKKISKQKEYWAELEKKTPKEKQDLLRASFQEATKFPLKEGASIAHAYDDIIKQVERKKEWAEGISLSAEQSYQMAKEDIKRIKPIEEVGMKKTAGAIADMAVYAYDVEKMKNLKKPIYISPENIFPEGYGSHPQELKKIILESRKEMVDRLKARGVDEDQAKKIAEDHVKATFDIGHAYTWRRFFKGSDPQDIEKTNKEFKEWVMGNVKDLLKSNVIGRAHISDNFGYYDEHVTPGQGIVPIKEFIAELKKAKVEDVIVEPAHQDIKALLGAWEHFGSSIYSALMPWGGKDRWSDIQHSYFGRTAGPNYIVGESRPSEDWVLWSGMPLE